MARSLQHLQIIQQKRCIFFVPFDVGIFVLYYSYMWSSVFHIYECQNRRFLCQALKSGIFRLWKKFATMVKAFFLKQITRESNHFSKGLAQNRKGFRYPIYLCISPYHFSGVCSRLDCQRQDRYFRSLCHCPSG